MEYIEDFKQLLEIIRDISGDKSDGYISLKKAIERLEKIKRGGANEKVKKAK